MACLGINGVGLHTFVPVAQAAGQPQVGFVVASAGSRRDNVLDLQMP